MEEIIPACQYNLVEETLSES